MANVFVIIPAAGIGQRMQHEKPKQFIELQGKSLLSYTISQWIKWCEQYNHSICLIVALGAKMQLPDDIPVSDCVKQSTCLGGDTRADSVLAALQALETQHSQADDWVLVHDAARPLVDPQDIERLYQAFANDKVGGILAEPVVSTVKRIEADCIIQTEARSQLVLAQTPQMFRYGLLKQALMRAPRSEITDESSAIEYLGYQPSFIFGRRDNIKITVPEDLAYALERITASYNTQADE